MPKEIIMVEAFKDGTKQAEFEITDMPIPQLKIELAIQEMQGRQWRTVRYKQFKEGE